MDNGPLLDLSDTISGFSQLFDDTSMLSFKSDFSDTNYRQLLTDAHNKMTPQAQAEFSEQVLSHEDTSNKVKWETYVENKDLYPQAASILDKCVDAQNLMKIMQFQEMRFTDLVKELNELNLVTLKQAVNEMMEKVDYLYDKDRNDGLTVALDNAPPELFENHDQAERKPQPQEAPRSETRPTSSRTILPRKAKPVLLTIQYGLLDNSFAKSMSFPTGTQIGELKLILSPLVNLSHKAMTLTLKANNALTELAPATKTLAELCLKNGATVCITKRVDDASMDDVSSKTSKTSITSLASYDSQWDLSLHPNGEYFTAVGEHMVKHYLHEPLQVALDRCKVPDEFMVTLLNNNGGTMSKSLSLHEQGVTEAGDFDIMLGQSGGARSNHRSSLRDASNEVNQIQHREAVRNRLRRRLNEGRGPDDQLDMVNTRNVVTLVGGLNVSMMASNTPDGARMTCLLVIEDLDQSHLFTTQHDITSGTTVVAIRSFVFIHMLSRVCHEHGIDLVSITRDIEPADVVRLTHDGVVMSNSQICDYYGMHEGSIIKIKFHERVLAVVHDYLDSMTLQSSQIGPLNGTHVTRYNPVTNGEAGEGESKEVDNVDNMDDDDDDKSKKSNNSDEAEWQDWDCVLCGKMCDGYGNNPAPLASMRDGRCCDECNLTKVIPARIQQIRAHVRAEEQQRMDEEDEDDEMDEESTVGVEESKEEA